MGGDGKERKGKEREGKGEEARKSGVQGWEREAGLERERESERGAGCSVIGCRAVLRGRAGSLAAF